MDIMFCVDSGGLSYDTFWTNTSLRGVSSYFVEIQTL